MRGSISCSHTCLPFLIQIVIHRLFRYFHANSGANSLRGRASFDGRATPLADKMEPIMGESKKRVVSIDSSQA